MADELKTEEEQLEEMRAWWSENGTYVIVGVGIAILGWFGYNYQQDAKLDAQAEASALYDTLADHVVDGKLEEAEVIVAEIDEEYAGTAYVGQSKLAMARLYMDKNRDEDAANVLRELLELQGLEELKLVAAIRLSKILLYQDKAEEALAVVEGSDSEAFAARFAEARGDALVALERFDEAREAYLAAIASPSANATIDTTFVQLKLIDLPAEEPAAVDEAASMDDAADEGAADEAAAEDLPADEEPAASEPDEDQG